jgi:hypothetical protein
VEATSSGSFTSSGVLRDSSFSSDDELLSQWHLHFLCLELLLSSLLLLLLLLEEEEDEEEDDEELELLCFFFGGPISPGFSSFSVSGTDFSSSSSATSVLSSSSFLSKS